MFNSEHDNLMDLRKGHKLFVCVSLCKFVYETSRLKLVKPKRYSSAESLKHQWCFTAGLQLYIYIYIFAKTY